MTATASRSRRGRWTLALVAVMFLGPLLAAWVLYYGGWRPVGEVYHGELFDPARPIEVTELPRAGSGEPVSRFLNGAWTLIVVTDEGCEEACREALYLTRQTRAGLGRKLERVERLLVVTGGEAPVDFLAREHDDLLSVVARGQPGADFIRAFPVRAGEGTIYVSDPLGNLMMRYAPGAGPAGLREDLKRLLKLSRIG